MRRGSHVALAALVTAAGLVALLLPACRSSNEKLTPVEWVKANTRIISQLASHSDKEWRQGVNRFLALDKEMGTEVVTYFLKDPAVAGEERVVVSLAWILSVWRDARGIPYLFSALVGSPSKGLRRLAAEGLANYGENRRVLERLRETAGSPDRIVRRLTAEILRGIKTEEVLDLLGERLRAEEDKEIRADLLLSVAGFEPSPKRLKILIDALTDPESEIRATAWKILRRKSGVPDVFDPNADVAARAVAISELRMWSKAKGRRRGSR